MQEDLILDEIDDNIQKKGLFSKIQTGVHRAWMWCVDLDYRIKIGFGLVVVLLGGASAFWYFNLTKTVGIPNSGLENLNPVGVDIAAPEEPRDQVSPLTGEKITNVQYEELSKRRPLAVIIENHPDARPQSGLDKADLVFEMLVEGGITRFVSVFLSNQPEVVGPVRSIRKYFLDLLSGLDDPLIMHIGGAVSSNPEANALAEIQKNGMKSLGVSGGSFWRVSDRFAPHNAYSSTKTLWEQAQKMDWVGPWSIQPWEYKDAADTVVDADATKIQLNWSEWGGNTWSVIWEFDAATNDYKRSYTDGPHVDAVTNNQLRTKNVVVVFAEQELANDDSARIVYDVTGSGVAKVFRDGKMVDGTWRKLTRTDQLIVQDANGDEIVFNRGQSWVMVAPIGSEVIVE